MPTRRSLLRSGIVAGSFSIVPVSVSGADGRSDTYRGRPVPYDIVVRNNARLERPITIRVYDDDSDNPILTTTYRLPGLNAPDDPATEETEFHGTFNAADAEGLFTVEASIPGADTKTTPVRMEDGEVADDQYVTVSVYPDETLKTGIYFSCK